MHLKPEELVDLAEGTRPESTAPHLAGCESCRRSLADLRSTMTELASDDVPEPSPLYWNQLSARVHEAVAAERIERPFWSGLFAWARVLIPVSALAAAAVVVLAVAAGTRTTPLAPFFVERVSSPQPAVGERLLDSLQLADDPSLGLVADLAGGIDWDTAHEAGLAQRGSAEHAVSHMNDAELRELRRLLQAELANSGG
jgi:hypothetical protein